MEGPCTPLSQALSVDGVGICIAGGVEGLRHVNTGDWDEMKRFVIRNAQNKAERNKTKQYRTEWNKTEQNEFLEVHMLLAVSYNRVLRNFLAGWVLLNDDKWQMLDQVYGRCKLAQMFR